MDVFCLNHRKLFRTRRLYTGRTVGDLGTIGCPLCRRKHKFIGHTEALERGLYRPGELVKVRVTTVRA